MEINIVFVSFDFNIIRYQGLIGSSERLVCVVVKCLWG